MKLGGLAHAWALCVLFAGLARAQTSTATARVETAPLQLTMPEAYQVTIVLEPVRRVAVVAAADGVIRSLDARLGAMVRDGQDLAQLDRSEGNAKLKMALAEVKEKQALVKAETGAAAEIHQSQLELAQARAELARLELDRCTVRAPFAGRVLDISATVGQYVLKGTTVAEIADTTSLRAILPIDRKLVSAGSSLAVQVEEHEVSCKVEAILPLPASLAMLRDLATPFAAAVVVFPNLKGELEPGLRVRPAGVPTAAIANVPKRAVRPDEVRGPAGSMVQVIRNEYVTNVPVQVLGSIGPDRIQVAGQFREADALIVAASVPLIPGTLVRFGDGAPGREIEGTSPNPSLGGVEAGITPPAGGVPTGRPGVAAPVAPGRPLRRPGTSVRPSTAPAQSSSNGGPPF
jgi:RND family efflux transporter MFP subunit